MPLFILDSEKDIVILLKKYMLLFAGTNACPIRCLSDDVESFTQLQKKMPYFFLTVRFTTMVYTHVCM